MLAVMRDAAQPFSRFALNKSLEYAACFNGYDLNETFTRQFNELAEQSLAKQSELENKPQLPFDEFLKQYFAQQ
jgi:glutamate--cysteine ligase